MRQYSPTGYYGLPNHGPEFDWHPTKGEMGSKYFGRGAGFITTYTTVRPPQARANLPKRGKIEDQQKLKSQYGDPIARVWGMMRKSGQVIWCADPVEHVEEVTGGSGGGTGTGEGETFLKYTYTVDLAISFCEGPIEAFTRIWAEGVLIYNRELATPSKDDITFYLGTEDQEVDPTMEEALGVGNVPAYRGQAYMVIRNLDLSRWDGKVPEDFQAKIIQDSGATVADIFADIFESCGLVPSDYDVADVGYGCNGYLLDDRMTARDALEHLCKTFFVDLVEIDGKIVAVVRGCSPAITIDEDDLACRADSGGEPPPKVSTSRMSEIELPSRIDITYIDAERKYATNTQRALRYAKAITDDKAEITVPIVLTANGARQTAERWLYDEWTGRTQFAFSVGPKYFQIAPGSPVNLPVAGEMVRVRVVGMDIGLFGALNISAVLDADYILTQEAEGDSAATTDVDPDTDGETATTLFTLWSVPELRDSDATAAGFYVAANSDSAYWLGASIWWAPAPAGPYVYAGQVGNRSSFGAATTTLSDGTVAEGWDETGEVEVALEGIATLTTATPSAVETGQNRALLGSEILGFADADLTSPNEYTLSTLKRGLRSTPMTGHTSEDQFVKYSAATVVRVSVPASMIGSLAYVKLITTAETLADVNYKSVLIGVPGLPYPVSGGWSLDFSTPDNSGYLPLF